MKAKDIMTRDVATLSPLTEIGDAARFLTARKISGAPVVDKKGNVMGVVSQTDLVRFTGSEPIEGWDESEERPRLKTPLISVMTGSPVTCDENTLVEDVARTMLERRIHRIIVTRRGRLCGIISAMDLLRSLPEADQARVADPLQRKQA